MPKIVTTEYMDEPLHEVLSPFRICLRLQKPVAYLIGKITKHKQMTSVHIKATFTKGAFIFGH